MKTSELMTRLEKLKTPRLTEAEQKTIDAVIYQLERFSESNIRLGRGLAAEITEHEKLKLSVANQRLSESFQ